MNIWDSLILWNTTSKSNKDKIKEEILKHQFYKENINIEI